MESNPDATIENFEFDFKKVSTSGSLFDLEKLLHIQKILLVVLRQKKYMKEF